MVSGLERSLLDDLCCVEHVGMMGVKPMPEETGVKPMPEETGVRPVPPAISASKLKMPDDGVLMTIPVASVMVILL